MENKADWIKEIYVDQADNSNKLKAKTDVNDSKVLTGISQIQYEIPEDTLSRFPSSFSGGQKQRIALARALCVSPKFLIADEPTSALDVSVQLRMLQLIKELKQEMGLTILFISHDMGVIYDICDEVAVMKDGKIEEIKMPDA